MERVVFHAEQRDSWNAYIAHAPNGHVLQAWEWGEVKQHTGWNTVRMALCDEGEIRAAAQVLIRTLPLGMGCLAYVPKGPVLDYGDAPLLAHTMASLRSLAAEHRVISLKIEPEIAESSHLTDRLLLLGLRPSSPVQMRSTIWVDLSPDEDDILARQKQKTRYNTKLAMRKGVIISSGNVDQVGDWYRMYASTAERDGFTIHGLEYYKVVMENLGAAGQAHLLLAHHDGDLLAGIIVFRFGHVAQYMYGASSNEKRNLMAPYLLQWEAMRLAKREGVTIYDLWGIPDRLEENEDLWGVYRHKRGYGGDIVRYAGAFDIIQAPVRQAALERVARPIFKRVARLGIQ